MGAIECVKVTLTEGREVSVKEYIEGEDNLRTLTEGSIALRPKIMEIRSKIHKEGVEKGVEHLFALNKLNVLIGDNLKLSKELKGTILKKVNRTVVKNDEEKVDLAIGTSILTYEVSVAGKKYEEAVQVRVEESPISKVELTKIKGREIELEENEEYIISLSKVEGSAIEYVKVTLAE